MIKEDKANKKTTTLSLFNEYTRYQFIYEHCISIIEAHNSLQDLTIDDNTTRNDLACINDSLREFNATCMFLIIDILKMIKEDKIH